MSVDALLNLLEGVTQTGRGRWRAPCPCCGGDNATKLGLLERDDGVILAHCFGCDAKGPDICHALGVDPAELFPPRTDDDRRRPRERQPFSAADALRCLSFEGDFLAIVACDLAAGRPLPEETRERLLVAAARIGKAKVLCRA
jgi:hypothetical protein